MAATRTSHVTPLVFVEKSLLPERHSVKDCIFLQSTVGIITKSQFEKNVNWQKKLINLCVCDKRFVKLGASACFALLAGGGAIGVG